VLAIIGRLEDKHILLRDRDAKFSGGFDRVLRTGLARTHVRYPEIQVVFADSRKFAEERTRRLLAAALADSMGSDVSRRSGGCARVFDPFRYPTGRADRRSPQRLEASGFHGADEDACE
jgi:hypothetical protein